MKVRTLWPALCIAGACAGMAALTWRTWPDLLVDFGREVYAPWQLAQGKVLYRDVAWFNGPLSPTFHSVLFRTFGASLDVLWVCNAVVMLGIIGTLHRLLSRCFHPLAAFGACLAFVLLFAFQAYGPVGNYNYLAPYSHEATHGLLLSLLALALLTNASSVGLSQELLAGILLGGVLLTKPECFAAAAPACTLAWWLCVRGRRNNTRASALTLIAGICFLPLAALCYFWPKMGFRESLLGILGSWKWILDRELTSLPFYRNVMGTADWAISLRWIAVSAACILALLGVTALAARLVPRAARIERLVAGCYGMAISASLWLLHPHVVWSHLPRAIPGILLLWLLHEFWKAKPSGPLLAFLLYALLLNAKIIFNVRLSQYGFVLAMPAVLVCIAGLLHRSPARLAGARGSELVARGVLIGALVGTCAVHVDQTWRTSQMRKHPVGTGRNQIFTDGRAIVVIQLLAAIEQELPAGATLQVLPEGALVNFWSGRPTSSAYVNFMPPELCMFGEARMLASLQAEPPSAIAIIHKSTAEYGLPFFGRDYGQQIMDWVRRTYRPIQHFGAPPLRDHAFGATLLMRLEDR